MALNISILQMRRLRLRLWLAKIRESRDGHEAVLLGSFITQCVL